MTQDCLNSPSTADGTICIPKGIHVVGAEQKSASKVEGISKCESLPQEAPWGYIFIQHMSAEVFGKRLQACKLDGRFHPDYFIHRSYVYKPKKESGGVKKELVPSVSGLIFLRGTTAELQRFLASNFPQYHLVNNCSTGKPASISHAIMKPFMEVLETHPERVTFLRDPFVKFAKDHIKLRVLTGLFQGLEGYVVRVDRDRQLVMNFGGYAVAIRGVHKEDFEVVG